MMLLNIALKVECFAMKRIHEEDLWVDRGRRPKTGVARASKTDRLQTGVLVLLATGLLMMVLFIAIALISQRLPAGDPVESTSLPSGEEVLMPEDDSVPGEPDLTIALDRIEWVAAFEALAEAFGAERTVQVEVLLISGYEDYQTALQNLAAADDFPDLIVVNGPDEAASWSHRLADLSNEPWAQKTVLGLQDDQQRVIGFPIDLVGQGLSITKLCSIRPGSIRLHSPVGLPGKRLCKPSRRKRNSWGSWPLCHWLCMMGDNSAGTRHNIFSTSISAVVWPMEIRNWLTG